MKKAKKAILFAFMALSLTSCTKDNDADKARWLPKMTAMPFQNDGKDSVKLYVDTTAPKSFALREVFDASKFDKDTKFANCKILTDSTSYHVIIFNDFQVLLSSQEVSRETLVAITEFPSHWNVVIVFGILVALGIFVGAKTNVKE